MLVGEKIERVTGLEQLRGALPVMGAADALLSGRKKPGKIVVSATMWASEAD